MKAQIKAIAVIGAGERGCEIASAALRAGYAVILEDVSESRLEQAAAALSRLDSACSRLATAKTAEHAVRDANLIIEAVAEEMEMKIELFTIFDKFAKPHAILASSSPTLSIADMASVTFCAERCIGMRFSPSADVKNVLQLVRSPETSQETVVACSEVGRRMGKEVVVVDVHDESPRPPAAQKAAAATD
jgi:3-hydroxyacyl-CoA dehydrogenase